MWLKDEFLGTVVQQYLHSRCNFLYYLACRSLPDTTRVDKCVPSTGPHCAYRYTMRSYISTDYSFFTPKINRNLNYFFFRVIKTIVVIRNINDLCHIAAKMYTKFVKYWAIWKRKYTYKPMTHELWRSRPNVPKTPWPISMWLVLSISCIAHAHVSARMCLYFDMVCRT